MIAANQSPSMRRVRLRSYLISVGNTIAATSSSDPLSMAVERSLRSEDRNGADLDFQIAVEHKRAAPRILSMGLSTAD
jgi:hypothetical protein